MAIVRTNRIATTFGSAGAAHGTGPATTGSFTPSNNSLLVAAVIGMEETSTTFQASSLTIADSLGTLTWTSRVLTGTPAVWPYGIRVWTAPIVTGASMTVTADAGAFNLRGYRVEIDDFTGHDIANPILTTGIGADADGNDAFTIELGAAPLPLDAVLMAYLQEVLAAAGTFVPVQEPSLEQLRTMTIDGWFGTQTLTQTGTPNNTVQWTDVQSGTGTPSVAGAVGIVIKAAATAAVANTKNAARATPRRPRYPL